MTKINLNRVFEVSKLLSTEPGRELQELIQYTANFAEQTIRALKNGLSIANNLDAEFVTVTVQSETAQAIRTSKTPVAIVPVRLFSSGGRIDEFGWELNESLQAEVVVKITNSALQNHDIKLLVFFS